MFVLKLVLVLADNFVFRFCLKKVIAYFIRWSLIRSAAIPNELILCISRSITIRNIYDTWKPDLSIVFCNLNHRVNHKTRTMTVMLHFVFYKANTDIFVNVGCMLKMFHKQTWYDFSIWKIKSEFFSGFMVFIWVFE